MCDVESSLEICLFRTFKDMAAYTGWSVMVQILELPERYYELALGYPVKRYAAEAS